MSMSMIISLTTMTTFLTISMFRLSPVARPPGDCYQRGGWRGGSSAQRGSVDTEGEDILQVDDGGDDDDNVGDKDEDDKDVAPLDADI